MAAEPRRQSVVRVVTADFFYRRAPAYSAGRVRTKSITIWIERNIKSQSSYQTADDAPTGRTTRNAHLVLTGGLPTADMQFRPQKEAI